ncbi:hypothetical protein B0T14DRAFT_282884 [Immersiella caudata]|uniref:Uncharacterized protein n=1 Tax=Immersiella caudata TaxID=314043 RepID=A0AA39WDZ3_9PEZI|nr:hypothetical protein B0T14DRAFT_282884 [Immersiella caudata]
MADFRVLDDVQRLFPEVTEAVDEYKKIRSDREIRGIARFIANEEALYTQFARKVSLLSQSSTHTGSLDKGSLDKLGDGTTEFVLNRLQEMEDLLKKLKADLNNFSVSAAVLKEIKARGSSPHTSRKNAPKTPFMGRLERLSELNFGLVTRLLDSQVPLPLPDDSHQLLTARSIFHHDQTKLAKALSFIKEARGPDGQGAIAALLRCRCRKCNPRFDKFESRDDEWDLETYVCFEPTEKENLPTPSSDSDPSRPLLATQVSKAHLALVDKAIKWVPLSLGNLDDGAVKPYQPENSNKVFMSLGDLMGQRDILDHRRRMELSFQLSSAVFQLLSTPFVDDLWTLDDWFIIVRGERETEAMSLFVRRKLSPSQSPAKKGPVWSIISRDSTLARLGIHLTELALGRSLVEIRQEEPNLLRTDDLQFSDPELLNLFTVRRLLTLRIISQRVSADFQDVVSACINQQYRDRRHARIQELDSKDPTFLEHATAAILMPLYHEVHKYHGPNPVKAKASGSSRAGTDRQSARVSFNHREEKPAYAERKARKHTMSPANKRQEQGGPLPVSEPQQPAVIKPEDSAPANADPTPASQLPSSEVEDTGDVSTQPAISQKTLSECGHSAVLVPSRSTQSENPSRDTPQSDSTEGQLVDDVSQSTPERRNKPSQTPRDDSDDVSEYSYHSYTESTFSAFEWLHSPPTKLRPDHPFNRFREVALQYILGHFQAWTAAGNGAGTSGQPTPSNQGEPSRKRGRNGTGKGVSQGYDDEDDNDEEMSQHSPNYSRKKPRGDKESPTFACPFLKKDPIAHQQCCMFVLSRIRDVKQHLRRRHQMPIYCPRCVKIFDNEDDRDEHVVEMNCPRRPGKPDGITERQKKALSEKAPASQSPETQWFGIFKILFPDHETLPQSPYMRILPQFGHVPRICSRSRTTASRRYVDQPWRSSVGPRPRGA